ncbi:MAG: F0F1 ATP synthase subunit alpha, partial [Planctomycetes bacterium]|nr:F0F1 ATP synthase subunit alpha [Planctomycetota bacterium]
GGQRGLAVRLDADGVGVVLLDAETGIRAGTEVSRTGEVAQVPVGDALLGRILDPLGRPLDDRPAIEAASFEAIERPAPAIIDRELVTEPLRTSQLVVDAMIPLGRGQRELVIGDRTTGKTSLAVDAMLSQKDTDVVCVYAAVGQKGSAVRRVIETVRAHGAFDRSIFVIAEADAPPGLQWIAPAAACTMAEFFRDRGGHALLVIDDLTKHAAIHRQISLLLRSPPGREAYPGDIFHLHARLLERAAKLGHARGGGSLTALPIAETLSGNLTAYIPTNLISITDGQIYLTPDLFNEGIRPAVDVGKSVSRVGGKAQPPVIRELAAKLKLEYSQFLELEVFTRFGQMVDAATQRVIDHGRRIRAVLVHPRSQPVSLAGQVAILLALRERVLDELTLDGVRSFEQHLDADLRASLPGLVERLAGGAGLAAEDHDVLLPWLHARAAKLKSPAAAKA